MAKQNAPKKAEKAAPSGEKLQQEIRQLAEELYKKRGNGKGDAMSDWLEAEKQVRKKYSL